MRRAALDCLGAVHRLAGDGIWKHLGKIPVESQRTALEEKFRRLAPNPGANPLPAGDGSETACGPGGRAGSGALRKVTGSLRDSTMSLRSSVALPPSGLLPTTLPFEAAGGGTPASSALLSAATVLRPGTPRRPEPADDGALAAQWAAALGTLSEPAEEAAVEGMKSVCMLLKDAAGGALPESVVARAAADADRLVGALTVKARELFERAGTAATVPTPPAAAAGGGTRGCKYALNTLMQTFQILRMARISH